jgi:hypothetical protein
MADLVERRHRALKINRAMQLNHYSIHTEKGFFEDA